MKKQPANNYLQPRIVLSAAALLLVVGLIFFKLAHHPMMTSYENADGRIYQCSKPIRANPGTAIALGHPQGLIPYNQADAARYCRSSGIE